MSIYGLAQNWWVIILRGLCAMVLGLTILTWPDLTVRSPVLLFGVYLLVDGILVVTAGLTHYNAHQPGWLLMVEGLVGLGVGVLTLITFGLAAQTQVALIAAWALITGMVKIVSAIRLRKDIANEIVLALSGIVSVGLGVVLVLWPRVSASALVWLIGIYALASGLLLGGFGLRLWRWQASARQMTLTPVEMRAPVYPLRKKSGGPK